MSLSSKICGWWNSFKEFKPPVGKDEEGNDLYVVEDVTDKRLLKSKGQEKCFYMVKWQGWPSQFNTWEPEENLQDEDVLEIIKNFERKDCQKGVLKVTAKGKSPEPNINSPKLPPKDESLSDNCLKYHDQGEEKKESVAIDESVYKGDDFLAYLDNRIEEITASMKSKENRENQSEPTKEKVLKIPNMSESKPISNHEKEEKSNERSIKPQLHDRNKGPKRGNDDNVLRIKSDKRVLKKKEKPRIGRHEKFDAPPRRKPSRELDRIPKKVKLLKLDDSPLECSNDPRLKSRSNEMVKERLEPLPNWLNYISSVKDNERKPPNGNDIATQSKSDSIEEGEIKDEIQQIRSEIMAILSKSQKQIEIQLDFNEPFTFNPNFKIPEDYDGTFSLSEILPNSLFCEKYLNFN